MAGLIYLPGVAARHDTRGRTRSNWMNRSRTILLEQENQVPASSTSCGKTSGISARGLPSFRQIHHHAIWLMKQQLLSTSNKKVHRSTRTTYNAPEANRRKNRSGTARIRFSANMTGHLAATRRKRWESSTPTFDRSVPYWLFRGGRSPDMFQHQVRKE